MGKKIPTDTLMRLKHLRDCGYSYREICDELGISSFVIGKMLRGEYDSLIKDCEPIKCDEYQILRERHESLKRRIVRLGKCGPNGRR